ncbi:MAG: hypothetical protein GC196_01190 [Hyphomonas sp.]|nr:hypothetical protein [Hyphomonas sp.]
MENADEPERNRDFDAKRVAPDDFDFLDNDGDEIVERLNETDNDEWPSCLPEGWGVFPHSGSGGCYDSLLVLVDGRAALAAENRATWITSVFFHVIEYLKRCPRTQRILFYVVPPADKIPDFLNSWRQAWLGHRAKLESVLPPQSAAGPPILRVCVRGCDELCFFLTNGRPAGGLKLIKWWRAASPAERGWLREAVRLVADVGVEHELNCSFIKRYGRQPAGLNNINVLTFGDLVGKALTTANWQMRIYLTLKDGIMLAGISGAVQRTTPPKMTFGKETDPIINAAVAVDMEEFYRTPFRYLLRPAP